MKILQIDVNCKNSSTGKIVYDLHSYAGAHGAESAVCYGRGPLVKENNIYKFGLDWETNIHALLTRLTGKTGCYSFFSTRRLLRFIKRYRPDVIHIHELHAYFVNIKPLLTYIAKNDIPVVWTFHCEFMYTGKCGYANDCTRFTEGCGNCPQLREYPKTLFFDRTAKMLGEKKSLIDKLKKLVIVTPSRWLADRVKLSFLKDREIAVVYNGIDTEIFQPRNADALRKEYGIAEDEKVALSVAPDIMSERKGGASVLKLAEKFRGEKVKFVLVGVADGSVPHGENVVLVPPVSDQVRLAEFYSLADVFVICSKKETFSLVCAESYCCGTPVAGFRSGAPEEIALPQYSFFAEQNDFETLAAGVRRILESAPERKSICDEAVKRYAAKEMCKKYFEIYERML